MRIIKKILLVLVFIIAAAALITWLYLRSTAPMYSGKITLKGLKEKTEVYFDQWGIPHIYAKSPEDAYFTLGYVHAQDRLFQMELIKRVATGRMAEIAGEQLLGSDRLFRTLGIANSAEKSATAFFSQPESDFKRATLAYLKGVNSFIKNGKTPLEFKLMGIKKEEFTVRDIYTVFGYVALGFSNVISEEPVVTRLYKKYGNGYLKDWALNPVQPGQGSLTAKKEVSLALNTLYATSFEYLPPLSLGSNAWALSPSKSSSGKTLLANDTHMFYSQPAVWYEAHIEYPSFSFYGHYLAGLPFGMVGHNRNIAWGLTIFPIDNMDMYFEKINPSNVSEVWESDHWQPLAERKEIIKIKNRHDTVITVKTTRHGPLINSLVKDPLFAANPVAVRWVFNEMTTRLPEAFFIMDNAANINEARNAASLIDVLGLNMIYADKDNNIAWWACGKISKRPSHVNSKVILDGTTGKDDLAGYYDFSENPREENPERGFVYSANQEPQAVKGFIYPGHYTPANRANRIKKIIETRKAWSIEQMKTIQRDVTSDAEAALVHEMMNLISVDEKDKLNKQAKDILANWNGDHQPDDIAPVIYNKFLYLVLKECMEDELGKADFEAVVSSYTIKRTYMTLFRNDSSVWWDNINTKDIRETRQAIFQKAFNEAIRNLENQLGKDINNWKWGKVHTLTFEHPIGKKKPFDKLFNVGPFSMPGSNEVINKMAFPLVATGKYQVFLGPTMRVLLDFADVENSLGINPTGQSGNVMSPHYKDQTEMFVKGEYRKQMMNEREIKGLKDKLILEPSK